MDEASDFIGKVEELRRRGAAARLAERLALDGAMAEMAAALGSMAAFEAMDTAEFPVSVERVSAGYESEGMPDFGATVTAVEREGGCSRLYVQAMTADGDEFLTLTLHPSRREPCWTLEASSRGHDGSESDRSKDFRSAARAIQIVRTRLLAMAIRHLSRGELAGLPVLPADDKAAAAVVSGQVKEAAAAGREADARRRAHSARMAGSANAIQFAWSQAESELGFLSGLGYSVGSEAALSVRAARTAHGVEVRIDSDENWAVLTFEAQPGDPYLVAVRAADGEGRSESKGFIRCDDGPFMKEEMRRLVLAEIEAAESSYLPASEAAPEASHEAAAEAPVPAA